MATLISALENALSKIQSARASLNTPSTNLSISVYSNRSTSLITSLPKDGVTDIRGNIYDLEQEQIELFVLRAELIEILENIEDDPLYALAKIQITLRIRNLTNDLELIEGQILTEKQLLLDSEIADHNNTIADLEAQRDFLVSDALIALEAEIALRKELFALGQTEPHILDVLVEMSLDESIGIRNSVDRILDGTVNLMSFQEAKVPLSIALEFDPSFDPETQTALYILPSNDIFIIPSGAGGWFKSDNHVFFNGDVQARLIVHEVNHALNRDSNSAFIGTHTGDDARAIYSFTTEVRAYDVDNRFYDDTDELVTLLESTPSRANFNDTILSQLGYDVTNLTGNEVFIAEHVATVTAGLPADLNNLTAEQHLQLERLFIADLVLIDSSLYSAAADGYGDTESVRNVINQIMIDGPGGNTDNSAP